MAGRSKIGTLDTSAPQYGPTSGPKIGTRSGSAPSYDPASGRSWRPGGTFAPTNAAKLYAAMEALGCSASGILNELVSRMEVDEQGRPVWGDEATSIAVQQPTLLSVQDGDHRLAA